MKEDIPNYIVKLGLEQGATDIAASLIEYDRMMIRFSNNEITASKNFRETALNIFLMIEKQRIGSTIPLSSKKTLEATMKKLITMAKLTPPADIYAPLPKGPFNYNPSLLKSTAPTTTPNRLVEFVEEAISSAREAGATKVAGSLIATKATVNLSTSGRVNAMQKKSNLEISIRAFTSEVASGHFVSIAQNENDFKPDEAGRIAGEVAKASSNPKPGQPGKYTALLGPLVFADLINQVGILSSAFLVDAGQSFLIDKIGSEVASEKFTLTDNPALRGTYGAKAFDDEGTPARKNTIIEKGTLKTYLHNSTTAKKFKTETTGNAGLVTPLPWNLVVEPGNKSFDDLLAEVDDGIYVTNDWYLRYQNYRTGDFSTIPRDGMFRIKRGSIETPIRELRISDNMLRILKNIRELSKLRYWVKWWEVEIPTLTPYTLVEDLNFTKSTM